MNRARKEGRRMFLLLILLIVAMGISGCSTTSSLSLSTAFSGGKKPIANTDNAGKSPQSGNGTSKPEDVIVVGHDGDADGGIVNGHLGNPPEAEKPDAVIVDKLEQPDEQAIVEKPAKDAKLIALTFDDGPDKNYTTDILDILKEKKVKATFFVVGQQVTKNPKVLERIVAEGHEIGNHTYNHKDLAKLDIEEIIKEIKTADTAIKKAVGFTPVMFRAPYGAVSDELKILIKENNREMIGWNIDTRDWAGTSAADIRKMIKKEARPNGIILMHSFGGKHIKNTVQALPGVIDDLKAKGFTFVFADQIS